ncbi:MULTISPECIES: glycine--tRNA ligase subunit beta [Deefgea]|uniref:Glycine--tRNA ligase beta subunit n=1 Tax=Deefgea chitinilytica TaxID=570276 RepID=A0ABS2CCR2_9NEIS|nr:MULTISPECIES: glycine--tRNA ligase subunit beta [Deefgea]MBM5571953.1 glycine--tRNA ligase subunit beta [Deefgea chitinilytica]MBM9889188.1 glycine--tRNA ligase subunit beta [Deefgea sp. CFH1-16]
MNPTLLIELFTEELPPKALPKLGAAFADHLFAELQKLGFVPAGTEYTTFASPRRLAVSIPNVAAVQPEQHIEKRGPAVTAGFKDGNPTPALLGFARSCGLAADAVSSLETVHDGKQDVYVYRMSKAGEALSAVLSGLVAATLKKLPAPKMMRWGDREGQFIRPAHGLVMLHGDDVIAGQVLHLSAGRTTQGHRFLSNGELVLNSASEYARKLHDEGRVIASFAARRALIGEKLKEAAAAVNATIAADDALFDEVTALVEWPVILKGEFEAEFLEVPQECLILTMQQNQKYFPLLDTNGKLMNQFLLVSNLQAADSSHIINGNERVLRARLSDAKFFFEQDKKAPLASRVAKLENVVYHNKIGSQLERVSRLESIAGEIARLLGADVAKATRAAYLAKADLSSDMVGEFPELQGIMGQYYAKHDGEDTEVAYAVEAHYKPKFSGDTLPEGAVAQAVSLADKLETLVGIYGIGLIPTGDKDPFALRRAALGVLRILLAQPLDLKGVLNIAAASFPAGLIQDGTVDGLYGFMLERLKNLLAADYPAADIDAVLAMQPTRLDDVTVRLAAVAEFKALPESAALAAANKRIRNILKKVEGELPTLNAALIGAGAEQALYAQLLALQPAVESALAANDFTSALKQLAALKTPVDAFFDGVMVMADDLAVRGNRLALLASLADLMNRVAELSLLAD